AMSPARAQTVYAVTSTLAAPNGLYVSPDDGLSWALAPGGDTTEFYRRIVPSGADAYLSGYDLKTPTGGRHFWKYSGASGSLADFAGAGLDQANVITDYFGGSAGALYATTKLGGMGAVVKSTDGGGSFSVVLDKQAVLAAFVDDAGAIWLSTGGGVLSSTDAGAS